MNCSLRIKLLNDEIEENVDFYFEEDREITIFVNKDNIDVCISDEKTLAEICANPENLEKMISDINGFDMFFQEYSDLAGSSFCQYLIATLKSCSLEEFFKLFTTVTISGSSEKIADYIQNNPEIKNRKIILGNFYELTGEDYQKAQADIELIKKATGVEASLIIAGNQEAVTIAEYKEVFAIINNMVLEVESLNLSPLEEIMYVYDSELIKGRIYRKEEFGASSSVSRDLKSVLLGDRIVCAGYTNILETVLTKLGHSCCRFDLDSLTDEAGHVRILVYVDDFKYQVNGLYELDVTYDRKRDESDTKYHNYYFGFAKTAEVMDRCDEKEALKPTIKYIVPRNFAELEDKITDNLSSEEIILYELVRSALPIHKLLGREKIEIEFFRGKTKKEIIDFFKEFVDLANRPIPLSTIANLIYNVRKIEYYVHPEIYPFTKTDIKEALHSYACNGGIKVTQEEKLLLGIFGMSFDKYIKSLYMTEISKINEEEMEQIKLTRTLRSLLENRKGE